jgi:hypothetical protein
MSNQARVELTIVYGRYGDKRKTIFVPVSDELMRELTEGVELSNDPFSLALASPGMWGGRGNAVTTRLQTFEARREIATEIAGKLVSVLIEAFGVNDKRDGYDVENDIRPIK